MVARSLGKKEIKASKRAQAALDKEWDRLSAKGTWNIASVREWRDVAAEAKRDGKTVHVGRVFGICVEKQS